MILRIACMLQEASFCRDESFVMIKAAPCTTNEQGAQCPLRGSSPVPTSCAMPFLESIPGFTADDEADWVQDKYEVAVEA